MDGMSLLDVLRGVLLDPAEQAAYNADPNAYLEQYGYDDVDPADLSEAFGLVADTLPPDQAQAAWSAAADPDDSSFGAVTPDFDSDAGIDDADVAPADVDIDSAEPTPVEGVEPDAGPDTEPETTLSFGEGEGAAVGFDDIVPPGDDSFDEADQGTTDGGDDGADGLDDSFEEAGTGLDTGMDENLGTDVDEGRDELDNGLDELDDQGPDDLDIGSF